MPRNVKFIVAKRLAKHALATIPPSENIGFASPQYMQKNDHKRSKSFVGRLSSTMISMSCESHGNSAFARTRVVISFCWNLKMGIRDLTARQVLTDNNISFLWVRNSRNVVVDVVTKGGRPVQTAAKHHPYRSGGAWLWIVKNYLEVIPLRPHPCRCARKEMVDTHILLKLS